MVQVFQRAASAPSTPTGGSYDFGANSITAPAGWSEDAPAGTDPLWRAQALASVQGTTGTDSSLSWSPPAKIAQDGADGTDGVNGIDGADGADGLSVAQLVIWRRASSQPSTPSGGSFDFGTKTLTPVTGWFTSPPAGSDPLYSSLATASVTGTTGTDTSLTWSTPEITVQDGADGADGADGGDGKSTYQAAIYRRASTQPSTPSGGVFNFGTNGFTALPAGWSEDVPADDGNPVWVARYLFSITGDTGTDAAGSWSTPAKLAEDGPAGADGADGTDGVSTFMVQVFRRSSSTPNTPSGGSYNFGTNFISPPSLWDDEVPAGTDPIWMSQALASVQGTTGIDSGLSWSTPRKIAENGQDGQDGADGVNGSDGADGDTVATGTVYYSPAQSSQPTGPDDGSVTFSKTTGLVTGMRSGWQNEMPTLDLTNTANKVWWAKFTATLSPGATSTTNVSFGSVQSATVFTDDIQSDNFSAGSAGWRIQRDTGNAEFGAASIRGKIQGGQLELRSLSGGGQIVANGSGEIVLASGGADTDQIASEAASIEMGWAMGSTQTGGGGDKVLAAVTVDVTGLSEIELQWSIEQFYAAGEGPDWGVYLRRDSTTIYNRVSTLMEFGDDFPSGVYVDTSPGSGSVTYRVWWRGNSSDLTAKGMLRAWGRKR